MTDPTGDRTERPWPEASRLSLIGPSIFLVVAVFAAVVAATVTDRDEVVDGLVGPSLEAVRSYPEDPRLPVTYHEALENGTIDDHDWGDRCDTERRYEDTTETLARLAIPSSYAPPCVPDWDSEQPWVSRGGVEFADNGGATSPGVTGDTIKVVFYTPAEMDISKQLQQFGVQDPDAVTSRGIAEIIEMNNHLYETYGRRVELVEFQGTGDGRSPSAAKADAVKVAEMGAFASIGGPSQTTAYQHELARHGVLCIGCGIASTDDVLLQDAPYTWGYLATPDQILNGVFDYGTDTLAHSKAVFAGDPEIRDTVRRFGIVHYEQDPPIFGQVRTDAVAKYAAKGASAEVIIQYILDPNSLNAQAQAIIGRLKREEITSVIFLGDPLMPRLLTQQATRQDYYPEWIFTGTAYTDMTSIGRLYDPAQMANAYGTSSAAVRTSPEASEAWQTYRWWYGRDPEAVRTMVQWYPIIQILYLGIHMAGPDLTPETFAGGLFRYPPTGGSDLVDKTGIDLFLGGYLQGDTTPRISFGFNNDNDKPDFVAVDDFGPIWWDPDREGPDEAGNMGRGMWMYAGLGVRTPLSNPKMPDGVGSKFLFKNWLDEADPEMAELAEAAGIGRVRIAAPIVEETPPINQFWLDPQRIEQGYETWPESPAAQGS